MPVVGPAPAVAAPLLPALLLLPPLLVPPLLEPALGEPALLEPAEEPGAPACVAGLPALATLPVLPLPPPPKADDAPPKSVALDRFSVPGLSMPCAHATKLAMHARYPTRTNAPAFDK